MPTVAELERLQALAEQLLPLTRKRRGELIEAEDWNVVVGALVEVARAAVTGSADGAVPAHEHPDQVGVGWLDPRLRQIITGGGLPDPAAGADLRGLRRDLGALTQRLDRSDLALDQVRVRVTEVGTDVAVRNNDLTRLDRKLLGAADARSDVADLRSTLRSLQTDVSRAVEVGAKLDVDGQPLDAAALVARVSEIEGLRDRLTRADGTVLDAAEFDRQVAGLSSSLVSSDTLTEALKELRADVLDRAGGNPDAVRETARAAAIEATREAVQGSLDGIVADLRGELAQGLRGIEPAIKDAVAGATRGLADRVLNAARDEFGSMVDGRVRELRADLGNEFGKALEERTGDLYAKLDEVASHVGDLVGRHLEERLPTLLAPVEERLRKLEVDTRGLDGRFTQLDNARLADRTRFEEVARTETKARTDLQTDLVGRLAAADQQLPARVAAEVEAARQSIRAEMGSAVDAMRRDLGTELAGVARQQAATEVQVLSTAVRTDVQSVIRQEIDASLAGVRDSMAQEVAGLQQRVNGLVVAEVGRATANLPGLVATQIEAWKPELTRIIDGRIGGGVLRPPFDPRRPPIG